jgi:hypothetical protein
MSSSRRLVTSGSPLEPYDPTIYLGSAAHYLYGRPRTHRNLRPS